jgi:hypothetical protein
MPRRLSTKFNNAMRHPLAARDVAAGDSWAFRSHRTMKQVMADEAQPLARRRQSARREIVARLTL